jgi:hypothetical protein
MAVLAFEIEPRRKPVAVTRFAAVPAILRDKLDPHTLNPEK